MTTEEKALALVNAVQAERNWPISKRMHRGVYSFDEALCRAIEAHEADKKAFSDAVLDWVEADRRGADARRRASEHLTTFILPEPDPLVEARRQIADRVLRQYGAPASDEDCIGLIVAALEEQAKIERIEQ